MNHAFYLITKHIMSINSSVIQPCNYVNFIHVKINNKEIMFKFQMIIINEALK